MTRLTPERLRARLLCVAMLALPTLSMAAENTQIFKCTDGSGNVTYQNEPCPKAAKAGRVDIFDNRWSATKQEREAEWRRTASDHRVVAGMPARWVRESLGDPTEIRDAPTAGATQLWLYTLPERTIQVGMLNDQVLWFRETPTATGQAGRGPGEQSASQVSQQAAPQISRSAPPVDRPANLPTTRLAPPPPERPPINAAPPVASAERSADAAAAQGSRTASGPVTIGNESVIAGAASADATNATTGTASAPTPVTPAAPTESAANPANAATAKPAAAPRAVARGQDCKQALADLGPPSRQRDVPALDTSSDPATEYFYESSDAGRLRIVCSNGKVEGVDRSVVR